MSNEAVKTKKKMGRPRKDEPPRPKKEKRPVGRPRKLPVQTEPKKMGRPLAITSSSPVAQLRAKLNISQTEFGSLLMLTQASVGRLERGETKPRGLVLAELNKLLRAHGLPEYEDTKHNG